MCVGSGGGGDEGSRVVDDDPSQNAPHIHTGVRERNTSFPPR